jgi:Xaa-Pro aminopeptidase
VFEEKALIEKSKLNYYIYNSIKDKEPIEWEGIGLYRAVRTEKEINGFIRCHVADGVAMAQFWAWRSKFDEIDEYDAALYLDKCRYAQEFNKGLSF